MALNNPMEATTASVSRAVSAYDYHHNYYMANKERILSSQKKNTWKRYVRRFKETPTLRRAITIYCTIYNITPDQIYIPLPEVMRFAHDLVTKYYPN